MELHGIEISFLRFHKVDKFYWSPDKTIYSIMLFMLIYSYNLHKHLPEELEEYIRLSVVLLFGLYFVYRFFKMYFEYEVLKGYIDGEIKFGRQSIEFDGYRHSIEVIKEISFSFSDKKGDSLNHFFGSFNGRVSNGVGNSVTVTFKDDKTVTIYFQVPYIFKIQSMKPILISYTQNKIMSFNNLQSLLCVNYKDVQELKQEYFRDLL